MANKSTVQTQLRIYYPRAFEHGCEALQSASAILKNNPFNHQRLSGMEKRPEGRLWGRLVMRQQPDDSRQTGAVAFFVVVW